MDATSAIAAFFFAPVLVQAPAPLSRLEQAWNEAHLRARALNGRDLEDGWRFTKVRIGREGAWQVVGWPASTTAQA